VGEVFTVVVAVCAGALAIVAVTLFARRLTRPPGLDKLTWALELLLIVRAMIGVGQLINGDEPEHLATYVGYLISSVAILPIALAAVADAKDHWTNAVLAVAIVAVVVVVIRLQMTATGHA
jgi:hypothetical protein